MSITLGEAGNNPSTLPASEQIGTSGPGVLHRTDYSTVLNHPSYETLVMKLPRHPISGSKIRGSGLMEMGQYHENGVYSIIFDKLGDDDVFNKLKLLVVDSEDESSVPVRGINEVILGLRIESLMNFYNVPYELQKIAKYRGIEIFPVGGDTDDFNVSIIMNKIGEGGSLITEIDGLENKAHWLEQLGEIAFVMDFIHGLHYFHRDIKGGNLLMSKGILPGKQGQLFLGDWGSALHEDKTFGFITGTPSFMAPELLEKAADFDVKKRRSKAKLYEYGSPASDLYSFAVVFWKVLTNHYPFDRESIKQTYKNLTPPVVQDLVNREILRQTLPVEGAVSGKSLDDLYEIFALAWVHNPEERSANYPNVLNFIEQLFVKLNELNIEGNPFANLTSDKVQKMRQYLPQRNS